MPEDNVRRKLTTILCADVKGYSYIVTLNAGDFSCVGYANHAFGAKRNVIDKRKGGKP